jgi:hypothetical protein
MSLVALRYTEEGHEKLNGANCLEVSGMENGIIFTSLKHICLQNFSKLRTVSTMHLSTYGCS